MKLEITLALALCGVLHVLAQDTTRCISLNQACQLGIEKNTSVINARLEIQKSAYHLKEVKSNLYPQVEGYSDFDYYYAIPQMLFPGEFFGQTGEIPVEIGTKYDWISGFKASLILYNQSYFTSIKVAKSQQMLDQLSVQQKKEEVVYQVSQVYFFCKTTRSQIDQLQKNMKNTDHLLEILKLQAENGAARKIDYSKVLVDKNNLQTQIDNLNQLYRQQLDLLKYLIGMNINSEIGLSDSLSYSADLQNFGMPDFDRQSELKLLDQQIEVTTLNRKVNQQAYLPTLSGSGQYYYDGQQNEFNYFNGGGDKFFKVGLVGVSLSIPIFDGFEKHAKTRQYDLELQQLHNTRKNTADSYLKDFSNAIRQYNNSLKALLRQQENIKIAETDYNVTLQGYREQITPLSDLMLSENSLTEARLSFVNALLQLKNAELDVKKSKGELLSY